MNSFKIEVSNILIFSEDRKYRVLYVNNGIVYTCRMDVSYFETQVFNAKSLLDEIIDNKINLTEDKNSKFLDVSSLSETMKKKYDINLEIINAISKEYGPTFMDIDSKKTKDIYTTLAKTYSISKQKIRRLIRRWLQSGMNNYELVNHKRESNNYTYKKKPGRKSSLGLNEGIVINDEVKKHFNEAIEDYKSCRSISLKKAYERMIYKHYCKRDNVTAELIPYPLSKMPTERQFRHYAHKYITKKNIHIAKKSEREYRNDCRPLLSDSLKDVMGPGDMIEMDEVELDVSLLSEFIHCQVVGRPIVYVMTDVYTRMIVAFHVTFDNNSVNGFIGCLRNLALNKKEFCKSYGIELHSNDLWRSNFIPNNIRVDRGSEYRSNKVKQICREHNITLVTVPAAMGSMKGIVEQVFHQFHTNQNYIVENAGLITKRYDSNHHENATLNLPAITQMIIYQVLHHNSKLMENYPATIDMTQNKVHKTPVEIWNYGIRKYGQPRPISNIQNFIYSLLTDANASLSRKGIKFKGLYYLPDNNDKYTFEKIGSMLKKTEKFSCAYDISSVNYLYYIINGILYKAYLNPAKKGNTDFSNLSWEQYNEIKTKNKIQDKEIKYDQLKNNINLSRNLDMVVSSMAKEKNLLTDNIREARKEEKQLNHIIDTTIELIDDSLKSDLLSDSNNDSFNISDDEVFDSSDNYEPTVYKGITKEEMEEDAKKALLKFMEDSWR